MSLTAGQLLGQALQEGLVDEIRIDLIPVIFGTGIPYFGGYDGAQQLLENPTVVHGDRVTHLSYDLRRA